LTDPGLQAFLTAVRPGRSVSTWDLDQLSLAALYFHPDIPLARTQVALAQAQAQTASARPIPAIAATLGRGVGGQLLSSPWIVGAAIDILLEPEERRAQRRAAAQANVAAARAAIDQTVWQVRSGVAQAALARWHAQVRAQVLSAQRDLQRERVDLLARRLLQGDANRDELRREQSQMAQLELALAQVHADQERSAADLAGAIGVSVAAVRDIPWQLEPFDALPVIDQEALGLQSGADAVLARADVREALARLEAAQAQLQEQVTRRWPDIRLGPGYVFDQGNGKYEVTLGLEWPAALEGPQAEALARRDDAAQRLLALQAATLAGIERAQSQWVSTLDESNAADHLLERASQIAAAARAQFAVGALDRSGLLAANIDQFGASLAVQAAHEHAWHAAFCLEDAVQHILTRAGEPLPSLQVVPPPHQKETS
jgi:outer membrane protein TolC